MTEFNLIGLGETPAILRIRPGWRYREQRVVEASHHRTLGGALHTTVWGSHFAARIPLEFIDAAIGDTLDDWWGQQSRIALTINTSGQWTTQVVRLANPRRPLGGRNMPLSDRFRGVLDLQGIGQGGAVSGAPLILDHADFGTLDTFNTLL